MSKTANADLRCSCCLDIIIKGTDMRWGNGGWLHPWCPTSGTYLAEIEDSEGHPLVMRMPVGSRPRVTPGCRHKHSRHCNHG